MTDKTRNYMLFVLANLVTFTFISLLQVADGWLFVVVLLAMHSGIALFVVSKKRFMVHDVSVKRFYDRAFIWLALYIPLLLYKIVGYLFPGTYHGTIARITMTCVIVASVTGSILNVVRFYKYLFVERVTSTP